MTGMERYLDTTLSPAERAQDLLGRMSLEEKMAQVQCVLVPPDRVEKAKTYLTDGIGQISTLEMRRFNTLGEASDFQISLQRAVMENSPHHIPAIFHMEGLTGAFLPQAASFPSGIGRGSSWDPELEEQIAQVVSRQEGAMGITHVLAPVLDISHDSRMGRQGETYGESPTLAAAMGTAFTKGVQEGEVDGRHTESMAKHFLGFHNSEGGIHGTASNTPPRMLLEIYGKPFQAAIHDANLRSVMPCYCAIDGEPASVSKWLLTDVLRDEMGFDGVVASDYSAISNVHTVQHMYGDKAETGYRAMEAGMDQEMPIRDCYNEELAARFASGEADIGVLNTAVRRVLEAKFRMGLFEHPYALQGAALEEAYFDPGDRELMLRSARESLVLLKNNGVLPIRGDVRRIAVIGAQAGNVRIFFGGYTHISMVEAIHAVANSIAGIGDSAHNEEKTVPMIPGTQIQSDETEEFDGIVRSRKPGCRNLRDELTRRLPETEIVYSYGYPVAGNDESGHEAALEAIRGADLCILTLGGKHGSCSVASMGEGVDAVDIGLPPCQESFIRKAAQLGVPLVGVHFNGRPISSDAAEECLDAILEAWNPSEAGAEAIVDVLTGKVNPCGKMPVSTAFCAGQIPVYYNHLNGSSWHQGESIGFPTYVDLPHTPRYRFGYGLSYTTFRYGELMVDRKEVAPDGEVKASLAVTNTGDREGTEIVQLYVRDEYASMTRPVMELAGFARVPLSPGETKRVTFSVKPSQTAFLDREMNWKIEKGEMELMAGASSEDIRSRAAVTVTADAFIAGRERQFYAETVVEDYE